MDELNSRLAEILNDPQSMDRVRKMAENILSGNGDNTENGYQIGDENTDSADISKIMHIVSLLKAPANDNRTRLLLALKPNLSEKRQEKVDSAVKLLRLIEILPILKDSGLLDFP